MHSNLHCRLLVVQMKHNMYYLQTKVFGFWRLPRFHCARQPPPQQRWCVWPSGTGCPPCSSWGTLGRSAWPFPPEGERRTWSCPTDLRCSHETSAPINTPCSPARLPWPWLATSPTRLTNLRVYLSTPSRFQECGSARNETVIELPPSKQRFTFGTRMCSISRRDEGQCSDFRPCPSAPVGRTCVQCYCYVLI